MDLFAARKERTAEEDEQRKQQGRVTSFECFVGSFFDDLAPWEKDTMPLKRFMVNHGEEFSTKYPVVYDTFCQELVSRLRCELDEPKAKELMIGLVAQSLITPEAFAEGVSLWYINDEISPILSNMAGTEAIQAGLKYKDEDTRKQLWQAMKKKFHQQFPAARPLTDDDASIALACSMFSTQSQLSEKWINEHYHIIQQKLDFLLAILPTVLLTIISQYAISLTDIE